MSKKVLFIVGSLRQGSFNHQMALEAEKALAGKAEVSYLDYSAVKQKLATLIIQPFLSSAKIWKFQLTQL